MSQAQSSSSDVDAAKRFLFLHAEVPRHSTGNLDIHFDYKTGQVASVLRLLQSDDDANLVPGLIENSIKKSGTLLNRQATLYALAYSSCNATSPAIKHMLLRIVPNFVANVEELHQFVKYMTLINKKFSSALMKMVAKYYLSMSPDKLVFEITKSKGYHSWTHKDLIKLSHPRMTEILTTIILTYVMFGLKQTIKLVNSETVTSTGKDDEAKKLLDHLTLMEELKRCEFEPRIVELIKELKISNINQVPSFYHKSIQIWEAIVPFLPVPELIEYLPRLYKLLLLKAGSATYTRIVETLTDAQKIKDSKIEPVKIFIALKTIEKGGKELHPRLVEYLKSKENAAATNNTATTNSTSIKDKKDITAGVIDLNEGERKTPLPFINILYKTLSMSFVNTNAVDKSYCITVDVNQRMDKKCLNSRYLSCIEAAVLLIQSILPKSKNSVVAVFNNKTVTVVSLEKHNSINSKISRLRNAKHGDVHSTAPFQWAEQGRKNFDVFLQLVHHQNLPKNININPDIDPTTKAFQKYKEALKRPNTRLIMCALGSKGTRSIYREKNYLDISGFNSDVPKVIEAFSRGLFQ